MGTVELGMLEKLISEQALERAQVIARDVMFNFRTEVEEVTRQKLDDVFCSYNGHATTMKNVCHVLQVHITEVLTKQLALQIAEDLLRKNKEILEEVLT